MLIQILKSKIHNATITEANLSYIGSLTLDGDLMEAAKMVEYEKVQIVNANNGERIETYLIRGKSGSGICCLNGPAARKGLAGDTIVIISYGVVPVRDAEGWVPIRIFPVAGNKLESDKK